MGILMSLLFRDWLQDKSGATAIEYGLIAAGISLAIAAVIFFMGAEITNLFEFLSGKLQ
jgi:pilus assembly protein Flp/PilA